MPANIIDFINVHFPGVGIDEAEKESNDHYEIELDNDIELIFDANGNFLGIAHDENEDDDEQDDTDIHPDNLPQAIKDYISSNYPEETIIEAEIEDDGSYEITLDNGIEIEFDEDGNFLSAEDGNGEDDDDEDEDENEND